MIKNKIRELYRIISYSIDNMSRNHFTPESNVVKVDKK